VADDTVSVKRFRADLRAWLDRAANGAHVTILRSGSPAAVLIPAPKEPTDDRER
jgi:antitoxin (DNA-binding transcriptional repressor) of toxin-antitoxin stability system